MSVADIGRELELAHASNQPPLTREKEDQGRFNAQEAMCVSAFMQKYQSPQ